MKDNILTNEKPAIFTIGHSNHSLDCFLDLLKQYNIAILADVRSHPYGRLEHFNREYIADALKAAGIEYIFLGRELGARREEQECYQNGVAIYEKIAEMPAFNEGLSRLRQLASTSRLALMCAKRNPWIATGRFLSAANCVIPG